MRSVRASEWRAGVMEQIIIFCSAECLLLAQSGHPDTLNQSPLLGVKRTLAEGG